MSSNTDAQHLSPQTLLRIIALQTEIVKIGHDLSCVMQYVVEQLQDLAGASGAIVELAEGGDMVYRAASGLAAPQLGLRLGRQGSLSGLCVDTGQVLVCQDCESDPRVDRLACRKVGLRSMVVAPLFHQEAVVGALKVVSEAPCRFSDEHVRILQLMAELIAASMFYCAQYEVNELYRRATHDPLTGIGNRALFYDRLRQSLALAGRQSFAVAVFILDMDGLKDINDTRGHRAGDAAIKEMARRVSAVSRQSDLAARLGGDEFGLIATALADAREAETVAQRLDQALAAPFQFEETPLPLAASIGWAAFPEDGAAIDALVEKADQRMYTRKRARKGSAR
jgi:diguanylate cyclase (GGDEF)-like protein